MNKPILITFAGVPGSSKTPLAYYLSWNLGLPILNNDAMRTEVREDTGIFDEDEYVRRRDERVDAALAKGRTFIYDASVDRSWSQLAPRLDAARFGRFVVSMDLSKELVRRLYASKNYTNERFDALFEEHAAFLSKYSHEVGFRIRDDEFPARLTLGLDAVRDYLEMATR